jgi:hypothetical protein
LDIVGRVDAVRDGAGVDAGMRDTICQAQSEDGAQASSLDGRQGRDADLLDVAGVQHLGVVLQCGVFG